MCKKKYAKELDREVMPGIQGGPLMHIIAAKAVALKQAMEPDFKEYQKQIVKNAKAMAEALMEGGLELVSGGTDTHLILVKLFNKNLTGKVVEETLDRAGITVNKNTVPFDPQKPFVTSGIRLGTPALTTRGMKETEMQQIAKWIVEIIDNIENEEICERVRGEVIDLCKSFPLYEGLMD